MSQMSITADNLIMTSAKFNTVAVYRGTYHGPLLNTMVYSGALFFGSTQPFQQICVTTIHAQVKSF